MTGGAAGRVLLNGQDRGSGFAITDSRAVTAGHVVWSGKMPGGGHRPGAEPSGPPLVYLVDRGSPAAVAAEVVYQPEEGEPIAVTRVEVSTGLDVAVLHLQRPAPASLPAAGNVAAGENWRVETRPGRRDSYTLTGMVTDPHRRVWNEGGKETTLIQLLVDQQVGDYKGYSGSPVIAAPADGVLGVLVEQGRWRTSPQLGQQPPVANVLFAAPIEGVLAEFDLAGVPVARSVRDIPRPVSFEVRRPDGLNQVTDALIAAPSDGQLVGLAGMGGSGKSVLAAAAARDPKMREAFPDGRFWLELGPDPPLLQLQASLAAALGDSKPITDVPQGRARLSRLLTERRCLLVLDNVWDQAHVSAFAVAGPPGRVLVTTRDAATVPGATVIPVSELHPEAAMRLLAGWAATEAGQLPEEAELVARECGYLPLALAVCGALINAGTHNWPQLLGLLRRADLEALPVELEDYPHRSLAVALAASVDTLAPQARDRYLRLAVFHGQGPVPAVVLQLLWGLDQQHTSALIADLAHKSLLRAEAGRISLHDLQMDYLIRRAPDLPALHDRLLAAYRDQCPAGWASGPDDGYLYQHLARHLRQAARIPELTALLLDLDWMTAKLATGTISGLLTDYDTLPDDPAMRLVAGALRLSAHVLADHPGQLPSQLTGRLVGQPDPQLRDLLQRTRSWPAAPWLRPLTASLTPPGGPLQRTLTGHDGPVRAVAISADGRRAISGDDGGTVRVWDLDTGEPLRTLADHHGRVFAVAISADGRRAVSGGQDRTVRVWDLDTGHQQAELRGHDGSVDAVAISADGRCVVSGTEDELDGTVRVWDLDTGKPLRTLTGQHAWLRAVAVSADGRRVVSAGLDGSVRVWDLDTGHQQAELSGHDGRVDVVAVSADGRYAVSGDNGGAVRVWDLDTGEPLAALAGYGRLVEAVAVSADGGRAVSCGGYGEPVRVWNVNTGEPLAALAGYGDRVWAVAVSADGRRAVSGGDGTVQVWDLDTGALEHTLAGNDGRVQAVAISADGRRAVSGDNGGTVRVWDLDTGALEHTLAGNDGLGWRALAVSADGRRAVSGGDGTVRVWDLDTGALEHTLAGHDGRVQAVAISADGRRAVSGDNGGTVRVWDLDTGALEHTLAGHDGIVQVVAVSADGRRAVSGDDGGTVLAWDLSNGKQVMPASQRWRHWFRRRTARHEGLVQAMAISADGRRAVSGGQDRTVRVWDLDTGHQQAELGHDSWVDAVAISADGRRAVSGSVTVRVWDLDTGHQQAELSGHDGRVDAVAVSAEGRYAVSGGNDGTVRVWDLEEGVEFAFFASDSVITEVAVTPAGTRVIAGASTGPVHLLELCG